MSAWVIEGEILAGLIPIVIGRGDFGGQVPAWAGGMGFCRPVAEGRSWVTWGTVSGLQRKTTPRLVLWRLFSVGRADLELMDSPPLWTMSKNAICSQ